MNPKFTTFIVCIMLLYTLMFSNNVYINTTLFIGENTPTKLLDNIIIDDSSAIINNTQINLSGDLIKLGTNDTVYIKNIEFSGIYEQKIEGDLLKIDSLEINKPSNELNIYNDINIHNAIIFTHGKINNSLRTIILDQNASIIGENDSNRIIGLLSKVVISKELNAPNNQNLGNLGATITTNSNLGNTQIERIVNSFNFLGFTSAERLYNIIYNNSTNINAQLVLKYLSSELNGNNESTLAMYTSPDGGLTWSLTSANIDFVNKTITANNLSQLKSYTFAEVSGTPLPVEFSEFNATYNENTNCADLNWTTLSETNNDYFVVEKSLDGINFEEINRINSYGNSNLIQVYNTTDCDIATEFVYYRIKQVDLDEKFTFSNIESVKISNMQVAEQEIKIYPTLVTNQSFYIYNKNLNHLNIKIIDLNGNIMYETSTKESKYSINTDNLSNANYYVLCQNLNNNKVFTKKIQNIK